MLHAAKKRLDTRRLVWIVIASIGLAFILTAAVFYLAGGRWFVVKTPSMGEYAPVGTLVLSSVAQLTHLRTGMTILFHPPSAPGETYFHRIYSITNGAISTKGDANPGPDPWRLDAREVIGTEFGRILGIGWLVEALPILIVGGVILHVVTHYYVARYWRFPLRVLGWSLLVALAAYLLRPFVRAVLVSQFVSHGRATSRVIATGLFDLNVRAVNGTSTILRPGQAGDVVTTRVANSGLFEVDLAPSLGVLGLLLLIVLILVPVALCVGYAIRRPEPGPS
jgi:hypothetical protein